MIVVANKKRKMEKIQEEYGSEEALIETLVKKELYKVIAACGPLMTSLESVSETRTDLNFYITDQLVNGIYKTKLIQIEEKNPVTGEIETLSALLSASISRTITSVRFGILPFL